MCSPPVWCYERQQYIQYIYYIVHATSSLYFYAVYLLIFVSRGLLYYIAVIPYVSFLILQLYTNIRRILCIFRYLKCDM